MQQVSLTGPIAIFWSLNFFIRIIIDPLPLLHCSNKRDHKVIPAKREGRECQETLRTTCEKHDMSINEPIKFCKPSYSLANKIWIRLM